MIWSFIVKKLEQEINIVLMLVLESTGSSPGRQGFKMVVSADDQMDGSIGGGIMEHKLVVKARDMLKKKEQNYFFKKQIHRKDSPQDQSGMICSGEQTVVLIPISKENTILLSHFQDIEKNIRNGDPIFLSIHSGQISIATTSESSRPYSYQFQNAENWTYHENLIHQPRLYIIGGGHVGKALSRQMDLLGFHVTVFDDREGLNTMEENSFAQVKKVISYENIAQHIPQGDHTYVVIMSFGYRSDKVVFKQLLDKKYAYLGMMGSQAKIDQLFTELENEGISKKQYAHVYSPIGLSIGSKTPAEIGVSIAAEIIRVKNE